MTEIESREIRGGSISSALSDSQSMMSEVGECDACPQCYDICKNADCEDCAKKDIPQNLSSFTMCQVHFFNVRVSIIISFSR